MGDTGRRIMRAIVRPFRRRAGLASLLALTVGLGVGANLAVFGLLYAALGGAVSVGHSDRVVVLANQGPYYYNGLLREGRESASLSGPDYEDVRTQLSSIGDFEAIDADTRMAILAGEGRSRPVRRLLVTTGLLRVVGVQPVLGRLFRVDDDVAGSPVAILGNGAWRRHFRSDPQVLGRTILLDERAFTIVGVLPKGLPGLFVQRESLVDAGAADDAIVTLLTPGLGGESEKQLAFLRQSRDAPWLTVIGRVRPTESVSGVRAGLESVSRKLSTEYPKTNGRRRMTLAGFSEWRVGRMRTLLLILVLAATMTALVAVVNSFLLLRGESVARRAREAAIRRALGARERDIARVEIGRAVLLIAPGGALGLLFAYGILLVIGRSENVTSSSLGDMLSNPLVPVMAVLLTAVMGCMVGALGVWTTRRRSVADGLRDAGSLTVSGGRYRATATAFVVMQVAAAAALSMGSAVLFRSVSNAIGVDSGLDRDRVLVMHVSLPRSHYSTPASQQTFYQRALDRIRTIPGIEAAGVTGAAPLTGKSYLVSFALRTSAGDRALPRVNGHFVTPGVFDTLGMRLLRGRWFSEDDWEKSREVAVVDDTFCRTHLVGLDPIDAIIRFGSTDLRVIGVVKGIRQFGPTEALRETVYLPYSRIGMSAFSFVMVRTLSKPDAVGDALVAEVQRAGDGVSLDDPGSLSGLFEAALVGRRRVLGLLASCGVVVLLLTGCSLLAALDQSVAIRTREIAIRVALGATPRNICWLVARSLAVALAGGLAIGLAAGVSLTRAFASQLFEVLPADPTSGVTTCCGLLVMALLAGLAPLMRATRIRPSRIVQAE